MEFYPDKCFLLNISKKRKSLLDNYTLKAPFCSQKILPHISASKYLKTVSGELGLETNSAHFFPSRPDFKLGPFYL